MMSEESPQAAAGLPPGFGSGWVASPVVPGYRVEEQIGHGGMAVVFRAVDEQLGRQVALKVMAPVLAADDEFRQRFVRESRAAAAVDDPHIIPIYAAGEADRVLYIAMRYVAGGDVRALLRRNRRLPPARAAGIISAVASALDAAHRAGLVHRDVKPANILLDSRPGRPDHVYLSDFGLSKAWQASTRLTGSGQFLGTVDYSAPEQIEGRTVDGRTDQYALACVAFELLAGEPPFRREEGLAVMYAQVSASPPLMTQLVPEMVSTVDAVFARSLAKSPGQRYGTCGDFANALRLALGLAAFDASSYDTPASGRVDTVVASTHVHGGQPGTVGNSGSRTVTQGPSGSPMPSQPPPSPLPGRARRATRDSKRSAWSKFGAGALVAYGAAAVIVIGGVGGALMAAGHKPPAPKTGHKSGHRILLAPVAATAQTPAGAPPPKITVCTSPAVGCTGWNTRYMKKQPVMIVTSADGSGVVQKLTWSSWGGATAQGFGLLEIDNCNPDCAQGPYTSYPATVTLSRLTPYGNGKQAYAQMVIRAPSAPYPAERFMTGIVP